MFLRRHVLHDKRLQTVGIDMDVAVKESYDGGKGHHDNYDNAEDDPKEGFSQLLVGQYGDGNLLECRRNRCAHYRPPALPNRAAL